MSLLAGFIYQSGGGGGGSLKLDTTITSVTWVVDTSTTTSPTQTYDIDAQGFDAGSDYYSNVTNFGSIGTATYTDGGSTSRTIDSCYFIDQGTGGAIFDKSLFFCIDTTSVPNNDNTFSKIVIVENQTTRYEFLRSAANDYHASKDGGTIWQWDNISPDVLQQAQTHDFEVWAVDA